jgi:hypothetical protein
MAFLKPGTMPSYPYYLVPTIGLSTLLWGVIWWGGMKVYMRLTGRKLIVTRRPLIEQEEADGEWTMKYEIVKHRWAAEDGDDASESEGEDVVL